LGQKIKKKREKVWGVLRSRIYECEGAASESGRANLEIVVSSGEETKGAHPLSQRTIHCSKNRSSRQNTADIFDAEIELNPKETIQGQKDGVRSASLLNRLQKRSRRKASAASSADKRLNPRPPKLTDRLQHLLLLQKSVSALSLSLSLFRPIDKGLNNARLLLLLYRSLWLEQRHSGSGGTSVTQVQCSSFLLRLIAVAVCLFQP